jgi:hypothetical protein
MGKAIRKTCMAILVIASVYGLSGCFSSSPVANRDQYRNPEWAPTYHPGVRYYYLPDIETYYDLSSGNFIYFDRGQWLYSSELPPRYRFYDLYTGYGVALNTRVYEPWRYHQQYITSYPRYYYRDTYRDSNAGNIRGYNENVKKPIYSSPSNRSERTPSMRRNNPPSSQNDNQVNNNNRESQPENYNRRNVGQPVKVTPDMRQRDTATPSQESGTRRQEQKPSSTVEEKDKAKTNRRR